MFLSAPIIGKDPATPDTNLQASFEGRALRRSQQHGSALSSGPPGAPDGRAAPRASGVQRSDVLGRPGSRARGQDGVDAPMNREHGQDILVKEWQHDHRDSRDGHVEYERCGGKTGGPCLMWAGALCARSSRHAGRWPSDRVYFHTSRKITIPSRRGGRRARAKELSWQASPCTARKARARSRLCPERHVSPAPQSTLSFSIFDARPDSIRMTCISRRYR